MACTRYSCRILIKLEFSNIKFNQSPSNRSRVVARGQTDGRTDMTNLIVAFRNFENAPKIKYAVSYDR